MSGLRHRSECFHPHQLFNPPNNPMSSVLLSLSHFPNEETESRLPRATWPVGGEQVGSRTRTHPAPLASPLPLP